MVTQGRDLNWKYPLTDLHIFRCCMSVFQSAISCHSSSPLFVAYISDSQGISRLAVVLLYKKAGQHTFRNEERYGN
ncbi:hypothetical protein Naga_100018g44 [Nannochloropsis gaditana]|uniref:Uncharacterized protein n=1 Tax=Nannochloropsis gaditana TaxID=72520 RepID=W7U1Q5_9STRA|nr:hypothetical protein Naga_100018g44 [Nannochloropsis gaditana]